MIYLWSALGFALFAAAVVYGVRATRKPSPLDEARRKR